MKRCIVTHAPGGNYVCWTHQKFLPWSEPFSRLGCSCARVDTPPATEEPRDGK